MENCKKCGAMLKFGNCPSCKGAVEKPDKKSEPKSEDK